MALTEDQKRELAEIDAMYLAKVAEKEVFLRDQLERTTDPAERQAIEQQLRAERSRLEEDREEAKTKVRERAASERTG